MGRPRMGRMQAFILADNAARGIEFEIVVLANSPSSATI
jgi:hypothetical protein